MDSLYAPYSNFPAHFDCGTNLMAAPYTEPYIPYQYGDWVLEDTVFDDADYMEIDSPGSEEDSVIPMEIDSINGYPVESFDVFDTGVEGKADRVTDINNYWNKVDSDFPRGNNRTPPPGPAILNTHTNGKPTTHLYNKTWVEKAPTGTTFYTVIGWALEVARPQEINHYGRIFTRADNEFGSANTAGGLGGFQIPSWYVNMVRLLWRNRNEPNFPADVAATLANTAVFINKYIIMYNPLQASQIEMNRHHYTGPGELPVAKENLLT
ncbi:hypothetical protein SUNI508_12026 [Seiridium unicorne]|uniref:Uncharacterized protein n=1 Tax=Seiridium unicorne TaxID=138068 RepID=A0ABR2UFL8_9PEZI